MGKKIYMPDKMRKKIHCILTGVLVTSLGISILASLSACQNKQQTGALLGAGTGALLGSRFGKGSGQLIATGIGAVAGAFIGGQVGQSMDETDRLRAERAIELSPTGQSSTWVNPDTNSSYTIIPEKTYYRRGHQPCREYTISVRMADGERRRIYGIACRQPDGSWQNQ